MKATLVTDFGPRAFGIHHKLYRCDPGGPLPEFVIVSAAPSVPHDEVRIFASDSGGKILNFSEWFWDERETLDHELALRNAGYEVT